MQKKKGVLSLLTALPRKYKRGYFFYNFDSLLLILFFVFFMAKFPDRVFQLLTLPKYCYPVGIDGDEFTCFMIASPFAPFSGSYFISTKTSKLNDAIFFQGLFHLFKELIYNTVNINP